MRAVLSVFTFLALAPAFAAAQDLQKIVETHILPGYRTLATEARQLEAISAEDCSAGSDVLRVAYHAAFDAWIGVSHLRFGPSEINDRAFALAFWPDPRGATPKALAAMIRGKDRAVYDPAEFATVSVAARGFYALEFLLFDPQFAGKDALEYHCALIQAITGDIATNAAAILTDWEGGYGDLMTVPGNDTYRSSTEAARQVFTALTTGLEFTSSARLARPMGTFDRPRPKRAEARRSARSLQHVILSLQATRPLAAALSMQDAKLDAAFQIALERAKDLDDPVFAHVADPQGRFRVEVLKQEIDAILQHLAEKIGPRLGIAAGFNALDGD